MTQPHPHPGGGQCPLASPAAERPHCSDLDDTWALLSSAETGRKKAHNRKEKEASFREEQLSTDAPSPSWGPRSLLPVPGGPLIDPAPLAQGPAASGIHLLTEDHCLTVPADPHFSELLNLKNSSNRPCPSIPHQTDGQRTLSRLPLLSHCPLSPYSESGSDPPPPRPGWRSNPPIGRLLANAQMT